MRRLNNNIYSTEIKRAFLNKKMLIALLSGFIIAIWNFIEYALKYSKVIDETITLESQKGMKIYPTSAFTTWMGANTINIQGFVYCLIIPLLAAIPYAMSYYEDRKSGYLKNIVIRDEYREYLKAKMLSVFLTAGVVTILPMILNLMLNLMVLPGIRPEITSDRYMMRAGGMMAELFYKNVYIYYAIYFLIDFVYVGVLTLSALVVSTFAKSGFIAGLTPFIISMVLYLVFGYLNKASFIPCYILNPAFRNNAIVILAEIILLTAYAVTGFYYTEKNSDIM